MAENVQRQYVHLRKQRIMEYLQNAPAELSSFEDNNKEQVIETPKLESKLLSQDNQLIQTIDGYPSENTNDTNIDATDATLLLEEKQIFIRKYFKQTIEEGLEKFISPMENKDFTLEELLYEYILLDCILMEPIGNTLLSSEEEESEQKAEAKKEILQFFETIIKQAENQENHIYLENKVEATQKLQNNANEVKEKNNIEINKIQLQKPFTRQMFQKFDTKPMDVQPQTAKRKIKHSSKLRISATSTPIVKNIKTEKNSTVAKVFESATDGMVVIGPNGTKIALDALQAINWSLSGTAITRKILVEVFGRETLAFHSLTGKPSPAFIGCDKPVKNQLDQRKLEDVLHFVMRHTELTEREIRSAIITKCADENKMYRQREKKRLKKALKLQKKSKK